MIKCPLCDREWDDWQYTERVLWIHVCDKHLRHVGGLFICWCGEQFQNYPNADTDNFMHHCWAHGGIEAHFLACQLETE